ncbi:MAG: hypothetical protein KF744_11250 [Taibaiella sp.]|nr:hypothetical protein [Taibaiella sp.]
MTNDLLLLLLPIATALTSWATLRLVLWGILYPLAPQKVLGLTIQGALPADLGRIGEAAADAIVLQLANGSLAPGADGLAAVEPIISGHLDTFLAVRLKEKMPVIAAFIGEKTVGKLKTAMMEEITDLLPRVIDNYTASLAQDNQLKQKISDRIANMQGSELEAMVQPLLTDASRKLGFPVLVLGGVIGSFLALVLHFLG